MNFDTVTEGLKSGSIVLLDVRNKDEVATERIPGSHHIPLDQVAAAMVLSEENFQKIYGFAKPSKTTHVVTQCLRGGRATKAADELKALGYNAEPYMGSFTEWKEKGGPTLSG